MGWANGKTLFWIAAADAEGKEHRYRKGDIGFHHYAFRLRSRADVDALQAFLEEQGATIVDQAGEYYDDYYAVFFLDPDGMKLEGMRYGERHAEAARKRAAAKRANSTSKKKTRKRWERLSPPSSRPRRGSDRPSVRNYSPASSFPASRSG
jgi:Glyoxalase/Bleomycin resistance protein/Dioxygenase superfamily